MPSTVVGSEPQTWVPPPWLPAQAGGAGVRNRLSRDSSSRGSVAWLRTSLGLRSTALQVHSPDPPELGLDLRLQGEAESVRVFCGGGLRTGRLECISTL